MFDKVLNMLLNWLQKLRMFHFEINLNTDNVLGKTKKKALDKLKNS